MLAEDFWASLRQSLKPPSPCDDTCCADIVEQVRQLAQIAADLKQHLNVHAPIHRLPPDVLNNIFRYHVPAVGKDGLYRTPDDGNRRYFLASDNSLRLVSEYHSMVSTLLSISQVCVHWRKTSVNNSLFWSNVPVANRRWASVFLERSKDLPIILWGNLQPPSATRTIDLVTDHDMHVHRMSTISVSILSQQDTVEVVLPSQPAPHLRLFRLSSGEPRKISPPLPFGGDLPLLKFLELKSLELSWTWLGGLTGLTSLTIRDYPRSRTSSATVLDALRNLKNLSFLKLDRSAAGLRINDPNVDMPSGPPISTVEIVALPRLQRVVLLDWPLILAEFLQHLSLSSDVSLFLRPTGEYWGYGPRSSDDLVQLANALVQHYRVRIPSDTCLARSFHGLSIWLSRGSVTLDVAHETLQLYHDNVRGRPSAAEGPHPLTVSMGNAFGRGHCCSAFVNILGPALMRQRVISPETLILRGIGPVDFEWLHYWISQISPSKIMLFGRISEFFAPSFSKHVATAGPDEPSQHIAQRNRLCLPRLECLEIREFDFMCQFSADVTKPFASGLERRKKGATPGARNYAQAPAISVNIRKCNINPDRVEVLRAACDGDLQWDGRTEGMDEAHSIPNQGGDLRRNGIYQEWPC